MPAPRKPNGLSFATLAGAKAKKPGPKKITYWSFSLYSDYGECPLRARFKAIDKLKSPGNMYMDRGNAVHKICEDYVKGVTSWKDVLFHVKAWNAEGPKKWEAPPHLVAKLQVDLSGVREELDRLKKIYAKSGKLKQASVEDTWAFTKDWDQTTWNDWNGCWLRIKLDVGHWEGDTYIPTDWKTGKFKDEQNDAYIEQLELYALGALIMYPHAKEVRPRLVYIDEGLVFPDPDDPIVFTQNMVPALKELWAKRTKAMLVDTRFAPRPGNYCKYCHHRASNKANGGGQCIY